MCHHLLNGGVSIKLLADMNVMLKHIDHNSIQLKKALKKADLIDLDGMVYMIVQKWFYGRETDNKDIKLLEILILNGGSKYTSRMLMNSNTSIGKYKILLNRIFMNKDKLKKEYPMWSNYPTWVAWLLRAFYILFRKRSNIADVVNQTVDNRQYNKDYSHIADAIADR